MKTGPSKVLHQHKKDSIRLLTASSNYTYLILKNGSRVLSSYSLGQFELLLKENFLRTDRSHLVNRGVESRVIMRNGKHFLLLHDHTEI